MLADDRHQKASPQGLEGATAAAPDQRRLDRIDYLSLESLARLTEAKAACTQSILDDAMRP
jgi:hypothetical protein